MVTRRSIGAVAVSALCAFCVVVFAHAQGTGPMVTRPGPTTVTKVTVTGSGCSAFAAGQTTADCSIMTVPAKTRVVSVYADTTAAWGCSGTCTGTKTAVFGKSAGGNEYLVSFDVAATGQVGMADADLGAALARATAIQGGDLPDWDGATALSARFTSGTGNWGNGTATFVNAGSTTFYVETLTLP